MNEDNIQNQENTNIPPDENNTPMSPLSSQEQPPTSPSQEKPLDELVLSKDTKNMATLCHVLGIIAGFWGPLIIWLIKKDDAKFIDACGKEALNFQISMLIYFTVAITSCFIFIGFLLIPVLMVVHILFPILAAIKVQEGKMYQYPYIIRFLK